MAAAFVLLKDVDLTNKLLVRMDAAGSREHLPANELFLVDTTQQATHVVAGLAII